MRLLVQERDFWFRSPFWCKAGRGYDIKPKIICLAVVSLLAMMIPSVAMGQQDGGDEIIPGNQELFQEGQGGICEEG